jgi:hypothetical protein
MATKTCTFCGTPYQGKGGFRYCSPECKAGEHRRRESVRAAQLDAQFHAESWDYMADIQREIEAIERDEGSFRNGPAL